MGVTGLLAAAAARPKADATVERARASCLAAATAVRWKATEKMVVGMKMMMMTIYTCMWMLSLLLLFGTSFVVGLFDG